MNRDELVEATRLMRRDAADALGDISIGEAIAAVDRLQAEAQAARG